MANREMKVILASLLISGTLLISQVQFCASEATDITQQVKPTPLDSVSCFSRGGMSRHAWNNPGIDEIDDYMPLHIAARKGRINVVRQLLRDRIDPNQRTRIYGYTPLHAAVIGGHNRVIQELLTAGAYAVVNQAGNDEYAPLHLAAEWGHETVIKQLLEAGANPNQKTRTYGYTPLHVAAKWGHEEVAKQLLQAHGIKDRRYRTPLWWAASEGHAGVVSQLLSIDANWQQHSGIMPLYRAVEWGHEVVVEQLLNAGANPNHTITTALITPLHRAAEWGRKGVVQRLLTAGADVNQMDHIGRTPLHWAVCFDEKEIVQQLLGNPGININQGVDQGRGAPLHLAVMLGYEQMVEILLSAGADHQGIGYHGQSLLHLAALKGYNGITQKLLDAGIDPNQTDENGFTALDLAIICRNGYIDIYSIYKDAYEGVEAREYDYDDVIKILQNAGSVQLCNNRAIIWKVKLLLWKALGY